MNTDYSPTPDLTVAIAVGPSERWEPLETTLRSALRQHGAAVEVVVKVLGSHLSAEIRSLARSRPGARVLILEGDDAGIYDAFNRCAAAATGQLLVYLGCGDTLADDFVAQDAIETLRRRPEAPAAYGPVLICDEEGRFQSVFDNRCFLGRRRLLPWRNPCHSQGLVYRRAWLADHPFTSTLGPLADLVHTHTHSLHRRAAWVARPIGSFRRGGASNQRSEKAYRARLVGLLANCENFSPAWAWRLATTVVCRTGYWLGR